VIYDTEAGEIAAAYRQALELTRRRPHNADAHYVLSYALRYAGRLEESARSCEKTWSLDPSTLMRSCAYTYIHLSNYDRAREFARQAQGSEWEARALYSTLLREGKPAEALKVAERMKSRPHLQEILSRCAAGKPVSTRPLLEEALALQDSETMYLMTTDLAFCGDADGTIRVLRESLNKGYSIYPVMDTNPLFDKLRGDPRWAELRTAAIRYYERVNAQLREVDEAARKWRSER
jgi:hypothetical protein